MSAVVDAKAELQELSLKLCRALQKHPCLYATGPCLKRGVADEAWEAIAKECDDTVYSCKVRWRNIRYAFVRSLQTKSRRNSRDYYLFEELAFYLPYVGLHPEEKDGDASVEAGDGSSGMLSPSEAPLSVAAEVPENVPSTAATQGNDAAKTDKSGATPLAEAPVSQEGQQEKDSKDLKSVDQQESPKRAEAATGEESSPVQGEAGGKAVEDGSGAGESDRRFRFTRACKRSLDQTVVRELRVRKSDLQGLKRQRRSIEPPAVAATRGEPKARQEATVEDTPWQRGHAGERQPPSDDGHLTADDFMPNDFLETYMPPSPPEPQSSSSPEVMVTSISNPSPDFGHAEWPPTHEAPSFVSSTRAGPRARVVRRAMPPSRSPSPPPLVRDTEAEATAVVAITPPPASPTPALPPVVAPLVAAPPPQPQPPVAPPPPPPPLPNVEMPCGETEDTVAFFGMLRQQMASMNVRQQMHFKQKIYAALLEVRDDGRDFPQATSTVTGGGVVEAAAPSAPTAEAAIQPLANATCSPVADNTFDALGSEDSRLLRELVHFVQSRNAATTPSRNSPTTTTTGDTRTSNSTNNNNNSVADESPTTENRSTTARAISLASASASSNGGILTVPRLLRFPPTQNGVIGPPIAPPEGGAAIERSAPRIITEQHQQPAAGSLSGVGGKEKRRIYRIYPKGTLLTNTGSFVLPAPRTVAGSSVRSQTALVSPTKMAGSGGLGGQPIRPATRRFSVCGALPFHPNAGDSVVVGGGVAVGNKPLGRHTPTKIVTTSAQLAQTTITATKATNSTALGGFQAAGSNRTVPHSFKKPQLPSRKPLPAPGILPVRLSGTISGGSAGVGEKPVNGNGIRLVNPRSILEANAAGYGTPPPRRTSPPAPFAKARREALSLQQAYAQLSRNSPGATPAAASLSSPALSPPLFNSPASASAATGSGGSSSSPMVRFADLWQGKPPLSQQLQKPPAVPMRAPTPPQQVDGTIASDNFSALSIKPEPLE